MTTTTTIYLIRHAATPSNERRPQILQGSTVNTSLSERGCRQARRLAGLLSETHFDAVLCSPLLRARETAAEIVRSRPFNYRSVSGLEEVNVGQWERLDWETIKREFPADYQKFNADPVEFGYPGGESLRQVLERVLPVFSGLVRQAAGNQIAMIAHTVVNRMLLGHFLGLDLAVAQHMAQANCCVNILRECSGTITVDTMNSALHLSGME